MGWLLPDTVLLLSHARGRPVRAALGFFVVVAQPHFHPSPFTLRPSPTARCLLADDHYHLGLLGFLFEIARRAVRCHAWHYCRRLDGRVLSAVASTFFPTALEMPSSGLNVGFSLSPNIYGL